MGKKWLLTIVSLLTLVPAYAQEKPIQLPDLTEAFKKVAAFLFGLPTEQPVSGTEIYTLKFLLFLILLTVLTFFLNGPKIGIFKEKPAIGAVIAFIIALIGTRYTPYEPMLTFATTMGASITALLILLVPAAIVYMTYTNVKGKPYQWTAIGASCIFSGIVLAAGVVSTATRAFEISQAGPSALFAAIVGGFLVLIGIILLFRGFRMPIFKAFASGAKVASLKDTHAAIKDAMYETKESQKALNLLAQAKIDAYSAKEDPQHNIEQAEYAEIKKLIEEAAACIRYAKRLGGLTGVIRLRDELNRLKNLHKGTAIETEITNALTYEEGVLKNEQKVLQDLQELLAKNTTTKIDVIGKIDYAVTFLRAEIGFLKSVERILNIIEEEIEKEAGKF